MVLGRPFAPARGVRQAIIILVCSFVIHRHGIQQEAKHGFRPASARTATARTSAGGSSARLDQSNRARLTTSRSPSRHSHRSRPCRASTRSAGPSCRGRTYSEATHTLKAPSRGHLLANAASPAIPPPSSVSCGAAAPGVRARSVEGERGLCARTAIPAVPAAIPPPAVRHVAQPAAVTHVACGQGGGA